MIPFFQSCLVAMTTLAESTDEEMLDVRPEAPTSDVASPPADVPSSASLIPPTAPSSASLIPPTAEPSLTTLIPPAAVPSSASTLRATSTGRASTLKAALKNKGFREEQEEHRKKSFKPQPSSKEVRETAAGQKQKNKKEEVLRSARQKQLGADLVAQMDQDSDGDSSDSSVCGSMMKTMKEGQALLDRASSAKDEFGTMEE